jgi:hypothetical protein
METIGFYFVLTSKDKETDSTLCWKSNPHLDIIGAYVAPW